MSVRRPQACQAVGPILFLWLPAATGDLQIFGDGQVLAALVGITAEGRNSRV